MLFQALEATVSGFILGAKIALAERHNASLLESLGQVFKSGYNWAKANRHSFFSYKESARTIYDKAQELEEVGTPNPIKK